MDVARHLVSGTLLVVGAWLVIRELQRQATGRGGRKGLMLLGFAGCLLGVLVNQA